MANRKVLYEYNKKTAKWDPFAKDTEHTPNTDTSQQPSASPSSFALITWNIDFMVSHLNERLATALSYLQTHTIEPLLSQTPPVPPIILFQELEAESFVALLEHPMVRELYCVTDIDRRDWRAGYGVVTLVPRTLAGHVRSVSRTAFADSGMGRFALYVDLAVSPLPVSVSDSDATSAGEESGSESKSSEKTIRIANVHLESLRGASDSKRVRQLTFVAASLRALGIYAGLVAGDMNPIGPLDVDLPNTLNLVDAWTVCKQSPGNSVKVDLDAVAIEQSDIRKLKDELEAEGYTWGYQPYSRYPLRRMDKIFIAGNLQAKDIEILGVGLKTRKGLKGMDEPLWVSDHFGLVSRIEVV